MIIKGISLNDALSQYTVDKLKRLTRVLKEDIKPTRKSDLIKQIEKNLTKNNIQFLWSELNQLQRSAIAETIHSDHGTFDIEQFCAKYGDPPDFGVTNRWGEIEKPTILCLFILTGIKCEKRYISIVPENVAKILRQFVDKPQEFTPNKHENLPADPDCLQRDTERTAQIELPLLMRLIDSGKLSVSNKTFQPSLATTKLIASNLCDGDFYEIKDKENKWDQVTGPIKAFSWPLLLQAAKLVELNGSKLALTNSGRKTLAKPPHEILKKVWEKWSKTTIIDEFSRISEIKGQRSKSKRLLTAVGNRRLAVIRALKTCPVGEWISIDDFFRLIQASNDYNFEVARDYWSLYIGDKQYGSLGYQGYHDWSVVQGRFVLCFLFEYAATLGLIDVSYRDPNRARDDYRHMWGTDDLDFLSQYDGLQYIRLNPLGSYCLGISDCYKLATTMKRSRITVMPSLTIKIVDSPLSIEESLLLEKYAICESDDLWRLDKRRSLLTVENGHDAAELTEFLEARDDQLLPESVLGFISSIISKGQSLKIQGTATLVECVDTTVAEIISTHTHTKALCARAGDRMLVVKTALEDKFRKAVLDLGYGIPKV